MTFRDFLTHSNRTIHSFFWMGRNIPDGMTSIGIVDLDDRATAHLLYGIQKAISNFVRILTSKDIPVRFMLKDESYTDGKSITLTSSITEDNIDSLVGLALHEASHIMSTDFYVIKSYKNQIPSGLKRKSEQKNISFELLTATIFKILNWVEDRRIDWYVYNNAPGYQGYYGAMYNRYFNNAEVTEMFMSGKFVDETIDSYMFRIINMIHPMSDANILNGLQKIYDIIDLDNISRLKITMDALRVALSIMEIIIDNVENGDCSADTLSQPQSEALRVQHKFILGEVPKDKLLEDISILIDGLLTESDYQNMSVTVPSLGDMSFNVLFIKKINISDNTIPFLEKRPTKDNSIYINLGISDAVSIIKKLQFFNDFSITRERNLPNGFIDATRLHKVNYDSNIFYDKIKSPSFNIHTHLSIDLSGSMGGSKLHNVVRLCSLLFKITLVYKNNMHLVITGRGSTVDANVKPLVAVLYNSDEDTPQTFMSIFSRLRANGYTPDGLCFTAIRKYIKRSDPTTKSYFINLSDGAPFYFEYTGIKAATHTLEEVNKIRANNVKILSYFISEQPEYQNELFDIMYGRDAKYILPDNLGMVANSLNKLFTV